MQYQRKIMAGCFLTWTAASAGMLVGCAALPPNSFIDPTKVGMFPAEYKEGGVRRVLTPREGPLSLAGATEPTADDLVPRFDEYRIGPGDVVQIQIEDFIQQGLTWGAQLEVSPSGYIRLPQLELVKISGLTEEEFENEVRSRIIQMKLLMKPILQAQVTVRRSQTFSIVGSIRQPGMYPIPYADLRLLDAISLAGDMGPGIRTLYVIRRPPDKYGAEPAAEPARPASEPKNRLIIPPPGNDEGSFNGTVFGRIGGGGSGPAAQESNPAQRELDDALNPAGTKSRSSGEGTPPAGERPFAPIVFDPATGDAKEVAPPPRSDSMPTATPDNDFKWDDAIETEGEQRVIEIDVAALRNGDARQNIVIRNRDAINIPIDTGLFYVMGEVNRPGVFSFNEREVTLKQAVAVVGGFTPLAWPARTEIIRREKGTDKQITIPVNMDAIFAGLEDDVLLRDDDVVNVGTHFVAPFLFVIRNSFRFTYGFGFVYDRNFADKDAYSNRINPEIIEQQRRQNRGLPF